MREHEIDPKNCLVGCGDISINQINQRIDFKGVEKVFINKYTRNYFTYNDLRYRDNLKRDLIANIILNNNDSEEKENIYKLHNGGIDKNYYYTKDSKFKIYTYEEVKDGYILFANKNSGIIAYAKIDFS